MNILTSKRRPVLFFIVTALFAVPSLSAETVNCSLSEDINDCVAAIEIGKVKLEEGIYLTAGIKLKSNITLVIPAGTVIRLDDNVKLNAKAYGGVVNAVVLAKGTPESPLENVHLIIDGEIDGNKSIHTYEKGGCEGINFSWTKNSSIKGSGVIHSVNGDGIDIDAAENLVIDGISVHSNGGSGIHFGSPRPIFGSKNNLVMNVTSFNNGYERKRNGFDLSWPNPKGAVFYRCRAENNYRNWQIETEGWVVDSISSKGLVEDQVYEASYAQLNGEVISEFYLFSSRTKQLLKRDLKRLMGLDVPDYLVGMEY